MKAECIREKLKEAVLTVERVTGKNMSLPILSSVLIDASSAGLTFRATNLEVGVEVVVPAKIIEKGSVAVPGGIFGTFLGAIGDERSVLLETVNDNLSVVAGRHSTVIKSFPVADYPTLPRVEDGASMKIMSDQLVSGIKSVWYSASVSDLKPEIASVYMYTEGKSVVYVATDSFRLAEKKIEGATGVAEFAPMLVPYKNAAEIVRVIEPLHEPVEVTFNKNQISVSAPHLYVTSRLVAGAFPNYRQILPKEKKTRVTVAKRELIGALKLCQIFTDKFNQMTIEVSPAEKRCVVSAQSAERGENATGLDGSFEGEEISLNFNVKYILDCFQSIPEETIQIDFNGPGRPMIVRGAGNQTFTYLVMPLNK